MKSVYRNLLGLLLLITPPLYILTGCGTGLGEEVDLTGPVLTIESPANFSYVTRTFTLNGTCTDNKKVTEVKVEYSYTDSTGEKQIFSQNADISKNTWSATLSFDSDLELSIIVTATDAMKNTSDDSVKSITVTVDATAPEVNALTIKRNGTYTVSLLGLEKLKSYSEKTNVSSNKDLFQNEEFTIFAKLSDNYYIKSSTLTLYDESGNAVLQGIETDEVKASVAEDKRNEYFPEFTITAEMLTEVDSKYESGCHYFQPKIFIKDTGGNENELGTGYLCWYPERDLACVSYTQESGNAIVVGKGETLPITIFDDDGISAIYAGLVPYEKWETLITENGSASSAFESLDRSAYGFKTYDLSGESAVTRDYQISDIDSGTESKNYYLVTAVKDRKTLSGYESVLSVKATETYVDSADAPIFIIESPDENTSPALSSNKFTISGYTLDDKSVSKIAIAWVGSGNSGVEAALNVLSAYDFTNNYTDSSSLLKIWSLTAGAATGYTGTGSTTTKQKNSFSKEFDVTSDFKDANGKVINENKVFVLYARDSDNNTVSKTFRLGAYTKSPTFNLEYSSDGGSNWKAFSSQMISVSQTTGLNFRLTASGQSNLSVDYGTLKGTSNFAETSDSDISFGTTGDYRTFSYDQPSEAGTLRITLAVSDVLGNSVSQIYYVSYAEVPVLKEISCPMNDGTLLISGETLSVQAIFSLPVTVSLPSSREDYPYIALSNITNDTNARAYYASGSGTDTLTFTYTAKTGTESSAVGTPATTNPITLNKGSIEGTVTMSQAAASISSSKTIKIDAIPPKIDTYSPANNGIATIAETSGVKTATLTFTFSEDVYTESGTITVKRTSGWAIPPVISEENFLTLYNSGTDAQKIALIGSSDGKPKLKAGTLVAEGPYRQLTQGIYESNGKWLPDTSTKYILAYDIDIHGTSEKTAALRTVLEALGYHKSEYEVDALTVSGKTVTLTISDSDFIDGLKNGVEYTVEIPAGSFRDEAGNTNEKVAFDTYKFWAGKVATPVIRVNRVTSDATTQDTVSSIAECKTEVRIDSETPGATIKYGYVKKSKTFTKKTDSNYIDNTNTEDITTTQMAKNITATQISSMTTHGEGTDSKATFEVGDGTYTTGEKYGIAAIATKDSTDSTPGYEGAYKTVSYYENPDKKPESNNGTNKDGYFHFFGSTVAEGVPSVAGFPMLQNGDYPSYRRGWKVSDTGNGTYVMVSWEILNKYTNQTVNTNYQYAVINCNFGSILYTYQNGHW